MGFGVFIHRTDSIYDDSPAEQYQFPSQYLGRVQACLGDWVTYYEPRKVAATRGYFAVAKVAQIISDPKTPGIYFGVDRTRQLSRFRQAVPFNGPDGVIERGVLNEEGRISGRAQAAMRPVSAADFNRILSLGLAEDQPELPRSGEPIEALSPSGSSDRVQAPSWSSRRGIASCSFRRA
ncbi:Hypothetical protein NGAL_HAMBI2427_43020 [Neorhizobium galegae bv. orientalis]|nr:Hypothetical protein NGAL_HAMBI2427_43020 [Neorhizobium galegae bv. orientalis]